jgi:hypothetical protein
MILPWNFILEEINNIGKGNWKTEPCLTFKCNNKAVFQQRVTTSPSELKLFLAQVMFLIF